MIVSIDIGTSYSSICRLGPDGRAQPVDISTGASMFGSKYSLPSAVIVEDSGNVLVGQAAMNSRKHRPQNFRMEFKRNLGEDIPILLGDRSFLPEDLYTELFRHMKACAEKVDGEQVERAFLTYPASYGKKRKEKLCAAAKAAGLFDLELVDEPTAAAMCYCAEGYIEDGQTLLVYDFGGGTFDVSVIRYKDGIFRLLAEPEGLERCGGMDIDYLIAKDMWETVGREAPDGLEALEKNRNRHMRFTSQLNELAVKAKHHLSAADVFEEYIEIGADDVCYRLTAERFNEMAAPLIGQTIQTCRHALEEAGVSASELSAVLLVGGTSRIPLVKEMAQKISGKQPLCAADLELAVAQGALEYCIYQERDNARQEEEIKAKERARQEAEEKERKEQEAAKKKAQQEAEEKKRRKQEEEARERERRKKEEKDREWEQYLEKKERRERDLERIFRRREEEAKERARQEAETRERMRQEEEVKERKRREEEERSRKEQEDFYNQYVDDKTKKSEYAKSLRKLAEQGNADAMYNLGECYENGQGLSKDSDLAFQWYSKAAGLGYADAMYKLGKCYENGRCVAQNYTQAVQWYRKAAEAGYEVNMDAVKRLQKEAKSRYTARCEAKMQESERLDAKTVQSIVQFVSASPQIQQGRKKWFSTVSLQKLQKNLRVPPEEQVLLCCDNMTNGITGFIITDRGVYYKEGAYFDKTEMVVPTMVHFTHWNDFLTNQIRYVNEPERGIRICLNNGKPLSPDIPGMRIFWVELQKHLASMKQEKESDREYTLNIVRENQWFLINPPMKVCIDGSRNYSVENGASVQILLPAGPHVIEIKCSVRKARVNCVLSSDAQLYLKWNRVTGQIEADIK